MDWSAEGFNFGDAAAAFLASFFIALYSRFQDLKRIKKVEQTARAVTDTIQVSGQAEAERMLMLEKLNEQLEKRVQHLEELLNHERRKTTGRRSGKASKPH